MVLHSEWSGRRVALQPNLPEICDLVQKGTSGCALAMQKYGISVRELEELLLDAAEMSDFELI